jgi:outer membrane protein insertion porin family
LVDLGIEAVKRSIFGVLKPWGGTVFWELIGLMRLRIFSFGLVLLLSVLVGGVTTATGALAARITQIVVQGNERVENESIFSYLQLQQGGEYSNDAADDSVRALFQTGLFSDVSINQEGGRVVIRVVENPLINVVNFEGNSEVDDETLQKEVEVRERMIFTKSRAQSDTRRILQLYQRQGFYNVSVTPKQIRLPENRINLVFEIKEGTETNVTSITFTGNNSFSGNSLRSVIATQEKAWWRFLSRNTTFDADRLEFDKEQLRRHYLKNGFADVQIVSAEPTQDENGNFTINFTVDEGPRYTIADVAVNVGDAKLDDNGVRRAVKTDAGDTYNAQKVDKSVENLTLEASKQGFVFAKVEPKVDREPGTGRLNLTYDIVEGPRTYIERIEIVGNGRTLDEVIRRELGLFEGDAYNKALVERARRRLTALDFFEKIEFSDREGSAADKVVLVLEVVEKSTGSLSFSAGYSSVETIVLGIDLAERNLFGRGQEVRLNTQASFKKQQVDFSFTEPYFMGSPFSAGFDLFANRSNFQEVSSYKSEQIGGALRAGFRLDETSRVNFKYLLARRKIKNIDASAASPAILEQQGTSWKSAVSGTYTYDDLDNPIRPNSGLRAELTGEVAGLGGTDRFASLEASAWYFVPVIEDKVTLKFEGNAGVVGSWDKNKKVPFQDRFFKGADSFRGFASSGVGPMQIGNDGVTDSIGAKSYAIGTVEAIFPLGLPESLGVEGVVFSDFGTVFGAEDKSVASAVGTNCNRTPAADCTVFDSMKLRASIGAGVIWQSPFGPLRLEAAYPVLKAPEDKKEWFSFSIGTRF